MTELKKEKNNIENNKITIYKIDNDTIIYHGSFSNIKDGKVNQPAYYSTDIVQALAPLYTTIIGNILYFKNNIMQSKLIKRGYDYYPLIYKYKINNNNNNLLYIDYPNADKFKKLYNPIILCNFLFLNQNLDEIIKNMYIKGLLIKNDKFLNKLNNLYDFNLYNYHKNDSLIILINKLKILELIKEYKIICNNTCFGSYHNIFGYYLLSCIDFNSYFKEINIIDQSTTISGIFVPNDQNEIIFLNNNNLLLYDIIYCIPYYFKEYFLNNSKKLLQCKIKEYITKYAHLITKYNNIRDYYDEFSRTYSKDNFIHTNLLQHLFQLIIINNNTSEYIKFNIPTFDEHKQNNIWFFDFLTSNCTEIYPNTYNTKNCETYNDIYSVDNLLYEMIYNRKINYPSNFVSKSYAYGIVNENNKNNEMDNKKLCYLKDYIDFLNTYCTVKTLNFKLDNDWKL